jgi:predicted lactoylglutathione lyase
MAAQIYVNLSVDDLNRSIEFFTKLGFKFNPKFTDENAACMIIGDNIFVMLLLKKFFQSFTKKEICDASKCAEVINAIAVESRDKVDEMITKAAEAGGIETREPQDHGWMYGRSFQDLDGHLWEIFYMEDNTTN